VTTYRFLAVFLAALVLQSATVRSRAAGADLPVPRGLKTCTADGASASGMERMASALGGPALGCFQSGETAELHGSKKTYAVPVEYAFAVEMKGGPYAALDVDILMADVTTEWKGAKPLNQDTRADYERRLDGLIEKAPPSAAPQPAEPVKPPVLVSIEQLDSVSFAVVAIRQRQVPLNGESFSIAQVDAAAVVLKQAKLVRLSIARELRSKADVEAAREEIADWASAVAASP
jgi:hypothetical protein